jgi:FMN-dependent NADH-azoreductase
MSRLLGVSSSPRGSVSYSNQVAVRVIRELRQANPQAAVTVRDLEQILIEGQLAHGNQCSACAWRTP